MAIISAKRLSYGLFMTGLALLFSLGAWQLKRGFEKAEITALSETGENSVIELTRAPANWQDLNFQSVILKGQWLTGKTFLIDNRLNQGQPGYEVLTPFQLSEDKTVLLVNRGWIAKPKNQNLAIPPPQIVQPLSGQLYLPQKGFTLGQTFTGEIEWPLVILYYDFAVLSDALERSLPPVVVVVDDQHPDSFTRIWRPAIIPASRHYGYAVQWWGLALTLLIFGLIWRRRARCID